MPYRPKAASGARRLRRHRYEIARRAGPPVCGIKGISLAGLGAVSEGGITRLSIAGLGTVSERAITGISIAGLRVVSQGAITGISMSGLGVITEESLRGLNVAGLAVVTQATTLGVSIAGLAAVAEDSASELHGVQIGLLNRAKNNPPPFRWLPLVNMHFD